MGKNFLLSKTIWANVLGVVAAFLATKGINLDPDMQAQIIAGAFAVINIILRFVTKEPVVLGKPDES